MDPISHAIIGTAISKAANFGINFQTPENIGIVIGAIFPDIDIIFKKWGNYVYLKNHRAITHSIIGLILSALLISLAITLIFPGSSFLSILLWTFVGCLSHSFSDILNSYGAKFLWPIYKKKLALNILVIIDPLLIALLLGFIFFSGKSQITFGAVTLFYTVLRILCKSYTKNELKKLYPNYKVLKVIPSMLGIFKWHFVLDNNEYVLVGDRNILTAKIKIIEKFDKLNYNIIEKALESNVGKFFSDFTPIFHVSLENIGNINRYTFTDLRYYFRDEFYHHAVLEVDDTDSIVKSAFKPYTMNQEHTIPGF